ncbi:MAG: hypothetical protein JSW42_10700, partial [Chloroflexota bacterium]
MGTNHFCRIYNLQLLRKIHHFSQMHILFTGLLLIPVLFAACTNPPAEETLFVEDASIGEVSNAFDVMPQVEVSIAPRDILFGNISVDQGLSQSSVNSILQD